MKRTNIVLDEELIEKGMQLTEINTQRGLIDYGLKELVRRNEQKKSYGKTEKSPGTGI